MTKLRQAAQAALDALESDAIQRTFAGGVRMSNAAIALRAALAQPPAPTAPPCNRDRNSYCQCERKALMCDGVGPAPTAQPVQQPGAEPVTLADVLDALNCFNRPKPNEDDGPWEGGHFIRVDHLPDFINVIAAAWFAPAQRQPLSDEEIEAIWKAHVLPGFGERQRFYSPVVYARAIESAHVIAAQKGEKL